MAPRISLSPSAVRRLQRDLKELRSAPIPGVTAGPLEDDLSTWHALLKAPANSPYRGLRLHVVLRFPSDYPRSPPSVTPSTFLPHPNVFGGFICLDMLQGGEARRWRGWSAAYTASSVLLQLHGFLLLDGEIKPESSAQPADDQAPPISNDERRLALKEAAAFICSHCPCHAPRQAPGAPGVVPGMAVVGLDVEDATCNVTASTSVAVLRHLDSDTLGAVLAKLTPQDLVRCSCMGDGFLASAAASAKHAMELNCFFSKLPYTEAVLGYGVARSFYGKGPKVQHQPRGLGSSSSSSSNLSSTTSNCSSEPPQQLRQLTPVLHLLSWEAFQEGGGLQRSAWNEPIDAFIPLVLDKQHAQRALPLLERCVQAILTPPSARHRPPPQLQPQQVLQVLAQLMNGLVVDMVNANPGARISRQVSDAALGGFCHLHHLLLTVATASSSSPALQGIQQLAETKVRNFVFGDAIQRTKQHCSDLGQVLVAWLLTPRDSVTWAQMAPVLVRELLARHVRWIIPEAPGWFGQPGLEGDLDADRLSIHFTASRTSLCNVMFQAWFANATARPATVTDLPAACAAYDAAMGRPSTQTFEMFNAHAREVMAAGRWVDFLRLMDLGMMRQPPPQALFANLLRQAVSDSARIGYHRGPMGGKWFDWETGAPPIAALGAW